MKKWRCSICGAVYDPEKVQLPGEVEGAAKCDFVEEDGELVDGFTCKQCGAMKTAFERYNE